MIAIYQALGRMRKSQGFSLYVTGDLVRGSHYIVTTEKVLLGVMSCFEVRSQGPEGIKDRLMSKRFESFRGGLA